MSFKLLIFLWSFINACVGQNSTDNSSLSPALPTVSPTTAPTRAPTTAPTNAPTRAPTIIATSFPIDIFIYYNVSQLTNIILPVFNQKIAFATELGIRLGIYDNDYEKYKFIHKAYTCVSFTLLSNDANNPYECDEEYTNELIKVHKSSRYIPQTKGAKYLAIVNVLVTEDDEYLAIHKVDELVSLFNNTKTIQFIDYTEKCMEGDASMVEFGCSDFLGMDLESFQIITLDPTFIKDNADRACNKKIFVLEWFYWIHFWIFIFVFHN